MRLFKKMIFMTEKQIINQLNLLPESLKKEALDFIGYLLNTYSIEKEVRKIPRFGSTKGKYTLLNDFDAPSDDFKEYME